MHKHVNSKNVQCRPHKIVCPLIDLQQIKLSLAAHIICITMRTRWKLTVDSTTSLLLQVHFDLQLILQVSLPLLSFVIVNVISPFDYKLLLPPSLRNRSFYTSRLCTNRKQSLLSMSGACPKFRVFCWLNILRVINISKRNTVANLWKHIAKPERSTETRNETKTVW